MRFWKFLAFLLGALLSFSVLLYLYHKCVDDLPPPESKLPPSARISFSDGSPMYISRSVWINLDDFPRQFVEMLLASEDRNFFRHAGVDMKGIMRALLTNLFTGRISQGGSTITQQLARSLYLGFQRSMERKIKEMFIAYWIETIRSKEEILEMYLNSAYVGNGLYGFGAASLYYFGKPLEELNRAEMAVLIGIIKSPENLNPYRQPDLAKKKARSVVRAALDAGIIDRNEAKEIEGEINSLVFKKPKVYFDEEIFWRVIEEAKELTGLSLQELRSSYEITTTIDPSLQRIVESEVGTDTAVVAFDSVGRILAYKGKGIKRGRRQLGSAIKPVYYLYALLSGVKPRDILPDLPIDISGWSPENFTHKYLAYSTVENALVWSRNVPSVLLFSQLGYVKVVSFMKNTLKINGYYPPDLTLSLGTLETSPEEIAKFYLALANGGTVVRPTIISNIKRVSGGVTYTFIPRIVGRIPDMKVSAQKAIKVLKGMMVEVVERGTGRAARMKGKVIFGKTGTAEKNVWFIGGDDSVIMMVVRDGEGMLGGKDAAPIWKRIVERWGKLGGRVSFENYEEGGKVICDDRVLDYIDYDALVEKVESGVVPLSRLERLLAKMPSGYYDVFMERLREASGTLAENLREIVRGMREWNR